MTKTLSIDKAGRVVIPKEIRQKFGWNAGALLRIEVTAKAIILTSVEQCPPLVCKNGVGKFEDFSPSPEKPAR